MRVLLLILTITTLFISSCKDNGTKVVADKVDSTYLLMYPGIIPKLNQTVTTPNGNYYRFVQSSKNKCKIEWGNSGGKNVSQREFHFLECDSLRLDIENEDFIYLKSTMGIDLSMYVPLSLKQDDKEAMIEGPILLDGKNNTIVSNGFRSDTVLLITRVKSGQVQPVIDSIELCHPFFFKCLDSISLTETELYYKFRADFDKQKNKKTFERRVQLKI